VCLLAAYARQGLASQTYRYAYVHVPVYLSPRHQHSALCTRRKLLSKRSRHTPHMKEAKLFFKRSDTQTVTKSVVLYPFRHTCIKEAKRWREANGYRMMLPMLYPLSHSCI
jgi:hypothetical protein